MPQITRALVIRQPWASMVIAGSKKWEIRGRYTKIRGTVGIIAGGTGTILGVADLVSVSGPLSQDAYQDAWAERGAPAYKVTPLPYPHTFAWVFTNPESLPMPMPYAHPNGAVIWVKLSSETQGRLALRLHDVKG